MVVRAVAGSCGVSDALSIPQMVANTGGIENNCTGICFLAAACFCDLLHAPALKDNVNSQGIWRRMRGATSFPALFIQALIPILAWDAPNLQVLHENSYSMSYLSSAIILHTLRFSTSVLLPETLFVIWKLHSLLFDETWYSSKK